MPDAQLYIWDDTNKAWVKLAGTAAGAMSIHAIVDALDDITDVDVASPTTLYILYWNGTNSKWECRAFGDWHTAALHENGGAAEPNVVGLSGVLADDQHIIDAEAVSAMGAKADANPLNHDRFTDANAVSAMGAKADNNPLNHDRYTDANAVDAIEADGNLPVVTITFVIDGGGSAITTGQKGHLEIPFACNLSAWTLVADQAGAIVIDVWRDSYANFPPADADHMPGAGNEPTIAATNQMAQDLDITNWDVVAIAAGDILAFNVDSCTTITRVTLSLKATKT